LCLFSKRREYVGVVKKAEARKPLCIIWAPRGGGAYGATGRRKFKRAGFFVFCRIWEFQDLNDEDLKKEEKPGRLEKGKRRQ
jgi:hypothetical protein